jgi:hypothetical protein
VCLGHRLAAHADAHGVAEILARTVCLLQRGAIPLL